MSSKTKQIKRPMLRRISAWFLSHKIKFATIATLIGAYTGYTHYDASSLRSEIYQPLYQEVNVMAGAIQANNLDIKYSTDNYDRLTKNGNTLRIPKSLRYKLEHLYRLTPQVMSHNAVIARLVPYLILQEVTAFRTEADDKLWGTRIAAQLNAKLKMPVEVYGFPTTFAHTAVGPSINVIDPRHPYIDYPGCITWQANDWLRFPQSAADVTRFWTNEWCLRFAEHDEHWYYRITREDLANHRVSLEEFLRPTYLKLTNESDFEQLRVQSKEANSLVAEIQGDLADRINHPRHLMDLLEF